MAKVISSVLAVAALIPGPQQPFVQAAALAFAIGTAVLSHNHVAKPEQTETAVKTERPPRVKGYGVSRRYGASILFESINGTSVDVWAFHDGRASAILQSYLNDDKVTVSGNIVQALPDKRYQSGHVKVGYTLGQTPGTPFAAVSALLPAWDANHRGDGIVLGYMLKTPEKEKYFLETYPQGDNVTLSLVGQWEPTFDPRDPAQSPYNPATWTWSANAVRAFVHYFMVERGFDWNMRFEPQRARVIAAINDADVAMPLAAGGTEPRYRTSLSYKATEEPAAVISSLLACFDGWYIINDRREVVIYSGRFYAPTVSIGPDQIVAFRHQAGVATEDRLNVVAVPYVSELHDYGTVDGEAWRDEDDIAARGRENSDELGAVVPSHTQGRRLAKRKLSRTNAPDRGSCTTTYAGRGVLEQRYINLRLEEAGAVFFNGVAEVTAASRNLETGGTDFEWVAADPNVDGWNPATEDGAPAPVGNRNAPAPLAAPVIASASPVFAAATDAGTGARIAITAADPAIGGAGLTWYARWRRDSGAVWVEQEYADEDPGPGVSLVTGFVPIDAAIQVQIEYRASDGRLSGWSASAIVDTRTDQSPPDAATGLALVEWTDALRLKVDRAARATSYRWRFYAADGTTLVRQLVTATPEVGYTAQQAAADGARRAYVLKVAGVNGAGAGAEAVSAVLTHAAPPAVAAPAIAGGATTATATCTAQAGATGYVVFFAGAAGFDPATTGGVVTGGAPSLSIYGLAAGTYYGRIAAVDAWSGNPALLNLSAEISFAITTGGGSTPSGGGTTGGGYRGRDIAGPIP